jgi:recombination protein RecR
MSFPAPIQRLIQLLSHLPSVGPKTAERYVFYLLKQDSEELQKLAQAIAELKENITICQTCLSVSENNPCYICRDEKRDHSTVCIVARNQDLLAIEKTHKYDGVYLVLGGVIDAINGIKADQLNTKQLLDKIKNKKIKEVIIALNPTIEGETTTLYLKKLLKPFRVKITRLAKGLPMGAELEYADEITLDNAIKYRNIL